MYCKVRFWPLADIIDCCAHVRCRRVSGHFESVPLRRGFLKLQRKRNGAQGRPTAIPTPQGLWPKWDGSKFRSLPESTKAGCPTLEFRRHAARQGVSRGIQRGTLLRKSSYWVPKLSANTGSS